ncbi:putative secreted protein with PEP-CTERM sorting signal [Roseiarcus fermentans]|uniref:Putative secreted protein with PEP-CTERM sorting signal n=1 Tax=Roseiarcus fermentans TaxID=1473586 RepID=A0A366EMA9_9HYPH|nr:PEP-CTERM sorting domain-containing protein [Roseiarcus fermentans]RBP03116.1 putative secreted protein with PEP-CTERM sorting signal [Roseiarcus fermentans]
MRIFITTLAAGAALLGAAAASATTYDVSFTSKQAAGPYGDHGKITGTMVVNSAGVVTAFTGTASDFLDGWPGGSVWDGPVTLGQGSKSPIFTPLDDTFSTTSPYFTGEGIGLVGTGTRNAGYNYRLYNDYGPQMTWFGDSGLNAIAVQYTVEATAVPEASTWAMMAIGFAVFGVAAVGARRRSAALA